MTNPNRLNPARVAETVRELSEDAQMMMTTLAGQLNAVSFERAMQAGYKLACADFGQPVPKFVDPMVPMMRQTEG